MATKRTELHASIRFAHEDLVVLDEVQRRTGLVSRSDAVRFVLRQYARAEGIELPSAAPVKKRTK